MTIISSEKNVNYQHDVDIDQELGILEDFVRENVTNYVQHVLPSNLQDQLLCELLEETDFKSHQLVIQLLFSERLQTFCLEFTKTKKNTGIIRIKEDEVLKNLQILDREFSRKSPTHFKCLQQFLLMDNSEDPDLQGVVMSIRSNTGEGEGTSCISKLSKHLSECPSLTQIILPFASDLILSNISASHSIKMFQNIYRSTVTKMGIDSLAHGACQNNITHVVLCLNNHAAVPIKSVKNLLLQAPQIRVLELGGAEKTHSLYIQGRDTKVRNKVYNSVLELGVENPDYTSNLVRIPIILEGNGTLSLEPIVKYAPNIEHLILFGWEHIQVQRLAWLSMVQNIVKLELVGQGCNEEELELSDKFDCALFTEAKNLRILKVAGWGLTTIELDNILRKLPNLDYLYMEDMKLLLTDGFLLMVGRFRHDLTDLCLIQCKTSEVNLVDYIPELLPSLKTLKISSLSLDDPSVPPHFHLPPPDMNDFPPAHSPKADLQLLSKMQELRSLHLNVSYYQRMVHHDFTLPMLLIREFPLLRHLKLDNYLSKSGSVLEHNVKRAKIKGRLDWFLHQHNKEIVISIS